MEEPPPCDQQAEALGLLGSTVQHVAEALPEVDVRRRTGLQPAAWRASRAPSARLTPSGTTPTGPLRDAACRRGDASIEGRLAKTRRAQAAISYTSVTLTFFSTIYATLTFGYDPSPFILEIVSHAAMAGLDLKPWMTDIGALDAKGEPTDKLRHGSTFVTTMLVTKLFVPVKLPLAAALTPAVSRALRRYGVLGKAR